ncbi:hypothetical protein RA086_11730 [Lactiplantibacillus sp. WILCCON 0030]|uniref:Extracellular protein n=1 Tax=Lactiplantibacillus brownii TaxID=3069269 RepID=A0ABU1ACA9_9LACO|nr:hypothetical protein [Lactiplantibacillus brownii]MDQ7938280.1 hypothetical protein [Lactiplantibacillus brownii]
MRRKRLAILTVVVLAILPLGTVKRTVITAKTLSQYPQKYQRTWYHYDNNGKFDTVEFTAKSFKAVDRNSPHRLTDTMTLHVRSVNSRFFKRSRHPQWGAARLVGKHHLRLTGWNQPEYTGANYHVEQRRYQQQTVTVLTQTNSVETWTYEHYFTSQSLAKLIGNAHFPGDVYATSY